MYKYFLPPMLMAVLYAPPARAVWFDSLISEIPSDKDFISRPILNDTDRTNLYSVSAFKIDKPGKGGEKQINEKDLEILWAPLKFTTGPNQTDYFKLFYRGPADDIERYYRVVYKETPVRMFLNNKNGHNLQVLPITGMSTFLIVRPRKMRFEFKVDEKAGTIENTGNTYFRVIIHKGCNSEDEQSTQFYMLPGEKYTNRSVNASNKKFIVSNNRYHHLGNGCFTK